MMVIYDYDRMTEETLKQIADKGDVDFVFDDNRKDRGVVIGKDLECLEVYGYPRANYKRYNEWKEFYRIVFQLYLKAKGEI